MVSDSKPGQGAGSVPPLRRRGHGRFWLADYYRSAVGKKSVMAITGIYLLGFVLLHMLGNLKIYTGEAHLDAYSAYLRTIGEPILPKTKRALRGSGPASVRRAGRTTCPKSLHPEPSRCCAARRRS